MQSIVCGSASAQDEALLKEFQERIEGHRSELLNGYERLAKYAFEHGLAAHLATRLNAIWALDPKSEVAERYAAETPPEAKNLYADSLAYQKQVADLEGVLGYLYGNLAQWCADNNLKEQLQICVDEGLTIAPNDKELRETFRGEHYLPGYGWKSREFCDQYNAGRRPWEGDWKPLAEVQRKRAEWEQAWTLESDHWQLTTNCKESIGIEVVGMLEAAYAVFVKEFSDSFEIQPLKEKMRMNLFASKDELVAYLKKHSPTVDTTITQGNYSFSRRESALYFYIAANSPRSMSNVFQADCIHEATHQMFDHLTTVSRYVGMRPNFWIIEGAADYFGQTFVYAGGEGSIGSVGQLKGSSRWAYLRQNPSVYKTEDFILQTREDFMDGDASRKYCQATTLAYYLMEGDNRKYRERLKRYMAVVHAGDSNENTFAEIFGEDAPRIHTEYLKFLER